MLLTILLVILNEFWNNLFDGAVDADTGLFKKGKVMEDADVNLNYFTKIDIRTTTEIPLYSKSVEILTTHPEGSYFFEEDAKEQKVLKITNPTEFWSISKYLVIQVK